MHVCVRMFACVCVYILLHNLQSRVCTHNNTNCFKYTIAQAHNVVCVCVCVCVCLCECTFYHITSNRGVPTTICGTPPPPPTPPLHKSQSRAIRRALSSLRAKRSLSNISPEYLQNIHAYTWHMFIHVYVCEHMCVCVCTLIRIRAKGSLLNISPEYLRNMYVYAWHMFIHVYVCGHICVCVCTLIRIRAKRSLFNISPEYLWNIYMYMCIYMSAHLYACSFMYIRVNTYVCVYVYVYEFLCKEIIVVYLPRVSEKYIRECVCIR